MHASLADAKIRAAIERGEFNDLPLKGKPLDLSQYDGVSPEMRPALRVLKNSGVLPEEAQIHAETLQLRDLLKAVTDDDERRDLQHRLNKAMIRYEMLTGGKLTHTPQYEAALRRKLGGKQEED